MCMSCIDSCQDLNCMECKELIVSSTPIIRENFKFCSKECFTKFVNELSDILNILKFEPVTEKKEEIVVKKVEPVTKPPPKRGVQPIENQYKGYCTWCKSTCTLRWERDGMQFCTRDACTNYNSYAATHHPYDPLTFDSSVAYAFPIVCVRS